jgi:hypothetical protein
MALSKQVTPARNLAAFMRWAHAAPGYRVSEHPAFGGVTSGVHAAGSFHYDGLAADINWGINSPPGERVHLLAALEVAESMGLALIYARDGTAGAAGNHRTHLHVDVGEWSNYGLGNVRRREGDLLVWELQRAVFRDVAQQDNLWGANTDKRLIGIRLASEFAGPRFPYGRRYVQRVLRVDDDGIWGAESRAAHDRAVADIQEALGVEDDGVWGPVTDAEYRRAREAYRR